MSGFFETLAARAVGTSPVLRPRAAHRFEPAGGGRRGGVPDGRTTDPWGGSTADDAGAGLETASVVETASGLKTAPTPPPRAPRRDGPEGADRAAAPARPARPVRSASPGTAPRPGALDTRPDGRPPRAPESSDVRSALRDLAREAIEHVDPDGLRSATAKPDRAEGAHRSEGDAEARGPDRREPARPAQTAPWAAERGDERTAFPEPAGGYPPAARDRTRALPAVAPDAQPRRPTRTTSRTTPGPVPGADVDLAALLREEVFAALVDRGAVPARERPLVVPPGRRPSPPRPGTAAIRAEGVSSAGVGHRGTPHSARDGAGDAGPPTVHLHIDRVSVTRAAPAAPAPAAPAAPRRPSVDHSSYLARRRERG